jgi:hypothetical protein
MTQQQRRLQARREKLNKQLKAVYGLYQATRGAESNKHFIDVEKIRVKLDSLDW